jgi:hypothetical protein
MSEITPDERFMLIVAGVAGLIFIALLVALGIYLLRRPRK